MVLKKLSKSMAAAATAAMMVASPMMAMAANSPETAPTVEELQKDANYEVKVDEKTGNLTDFKILDKDGKVDKDADGVFFVTVKDSKGKAVEVGLIMTDGAWDKDFQSVDAKGNVTGFAKVGKEEFFAVDGIINVSANGVITTANGTYFAVEGRYAKEITQVASYDNNWFYVKNGMVDTTFTGTADFVDGSGTGLFGAGRLIKEFSGVTDDGKNSYYVDNGVVRTDLNGDVVLPDGNHYQFQKGVLVK